MDDLEMKIKPKLEVYITKEITLTKEYDLSEIITNMVENVEVPGPYIRVRNAHSTKTIISTVLNKYGKYLNATDITEITTKLQKFNNSKN